jgi:hypothetical protein
MHMLSESLITSVTRASGSVCSVGSSFNHAKSEKLIIEKQHYTALTPAPLAAESDLLPWV